MSKILFLVELPPHPVLGIEVVKFFDDGRFARINDFTSTWGRWRYSFKSRVTGYPIEADGVELTYTFACDDWNECQKLMNEAYYRHLATLLTKLPMIFQVQVCLFFSNGTFKVGTELDVYEWRNHEGQFEMRWNTVWAPDWIPGPPMFTETYERYLNQLITTGAGNC